MAYDELMRSHKSGQLSAAEVNQLVQTIVDLTSRVRALEHSLAVMPQQVLPIVGRIVSRVDPDPLDFTVPPIYYFELVGDGTNGTTSRNWQGAIRGTDAQFPAYERNGNRNVPIDGSAIVQLVASEAQDAYLFSWVDERLVGRITANLGDGEYRIQPQYRPAYFPFGEWVDAPGIAPIKAYEASNSEAVAVGDVVTYYRGPCGGAPRVTTEHNRYGNGTYWARQNVTVTGAVAGTFRLIAYPNFDFGTVASTTGIAWNAAAAAVQAALNGLPAYIPGAAGITVSGDGTEGDPWLVEFASDNDPKPLLMADESGLVGAAEWLFDGCCRDWIVAQVVAGTNPYSITLYNYFGESGLDLTTSLMVDIRGNAVLPAGARVIARKGIKSAITIGATIKTHGSSSGSGTHQEQELSVFGAATGTYQLVFNDGSTIATTSGIAALANAAAVKAALEALPNLSSCDVTQTVGVGASTYLIKMLDSFTDYDAIAVLSHLGGYDEWICESASPTASLTRAGILSLGNQTMPAGWKRFSSSNASGTGGGGIKLCAANETELSRIHANGAISRWETSPNANLSDNYGIELNATVPAGGVAIWPGLTVAPSVGASHSASLWANGTVATLTLRNGSGTIVAELPGFSGDMGGIAFRGGVATGGAPVPDSLGWGSGTPADANEAWERIANWALAIIAEIGSGPLP